MVLVALAIRLVVVGFVYPYWLSPKRDYYEFGYEPGRVARSLALGQGISNPLHGTTGPTALVMPVYPSIMAGCFKLFGIYSKGAAIAILSLNSLFSALTCVPIFLIGLRSFNLWTAKIAAWLWVFFPNAIYFSANWMWATCLSTLLLALLVLAVLYLRESTSKLAWIGFGLGCGVVSLTEPNVMSVLPFLGLWACYYLQRRKRAWFAPACLAAMAFIVVVSPWFLRNYLVFHRFIPFRDGMGLELYVGNNGYSAHWANGSVRPSNSPTELAEYARSGELAYMAHKQQQALGFIKANKAWYLVMTLRRAVYLWTGFWSFRQSYLEQDPLDHPNIVLNLALLGLAVAGLRRAFRERREEVAPYVLLFLFFPLIYCLTHPEVYYMRPLDPFLILLAAYALAGTRAVEKWAGSKKKGGQLAAL
jgi:4-amino-4-deoxy-L-arabinose transferase-like glycosyltransferase